MTMITVKGEAAEAVTDAKATSWVVTKEVADCREKKRRGSRSAIDY